MNGKLRIFEVEREDMGHKIEKPMFPVRIVKYADHLDLMNKILKVEVSRRDSLVDVVKEQLLQEFFNGNLKHTLRKSLVDDEKFVDTFIENLKEALMRKI